MEHDRFDRMARLLAASLSRRRQLAVLLGIGIGAASEAAAGSTEAASRPGRGRPSAAGPCGDGSDNHCKQDSDCCTGYCKRVAPGKRRCRCIDRGKKCAKGQTCCGKLVCRNKRCSPAVEPETCQVCASGCPHTTVAAAVAAAADGAVIPIAAGTYPTAPIVLSRSVTLKACNDVAGVILSKVAASDTYMLQDEQAGSATRDVTLQGLTIEGTDFFDTYGLVQSNGASNWTFTDCTFRTSNTCVYVNSGDASFTGCTFTGCGSGVRGSRLVPDQGDLVVQDCTFTGGGEGVKIYVDSNTGPKSNRLSVSNCTFTGNTSIGVELSNSVDASISGCTITGNGSAASGGKGGVQASAGTLTISDTTISGNTAQFYGGGISAIGTATLALGAGVIVTQNSAPDGSGIAVSQNTPGAVTVTGASDSNVYGNLVGDQCETSSGGAFTVVPNCAF